MSKWSKLIFDSYNANEIAKAVDNEEWQKFREGLKGKTLDDKYSELQSYLRVHKQSKDAKIRVTNYVNALARGGLIKLKACPPGWEWCEDKGECVEMKSLSADGWDVRCVVCKYEFFTSEVEEHIRCPECGNIVRRIDMDGYGGKAEIFQAAVIDTTISELLSEEEKFKLIMERSDEFKTLPYSNEHACRLKEPDQFDSFRRTSRMHRGMRYDIIWGVKDGKVSEQAYRYPKSIWSADEARAHCRSHNGISFEAAKRANSVDWSVLSPNDKYVLSEDAMKYDEIPPKGISGIPEELMKTIPARLRWWESNCVNQRLAMRNEFVKVSQIDASVIESYGDKHLIKCQKGLFFLAKFSEGFDFNNIFKMSDPIELVEADVPKTIKFVLMHHYWKGTKSIEHYDLFLGDNIQMVCLNNIIKGNSLAIKREPYSKDFINYGDSDAMYLKAGVPGNPSKLASWVKQVDKGEAIILKEDDNYMRLKFQGKMLSDVMEVKKTETGSWEIKTSRDLSGHTPSIIRMSLKANEAYYEGEDLIVPGFALSYGVWNGEYYPKEVVLDNPGRIVGIPISVGTHNNERNCGFVKSYEIINDSIHIKAVIPKEFKAEQERVLNGEFVGWSVEVNVKHDPMRRIIEKIVNYDRVVAVDIPACTVCTLDGVCPDVPGMFNSEYNS
jgi:predicted RNA-binding Zn-ribbon protein involved in translation (DUF1610 family)